jgi:hypothetical protein
MKNNSLYIAFIAVVVIGCSTEEIVKAEAKNIITGTVFKDGAPASNACVLVETSHEVDSVSLEGQVDSDGRFEIDMGERKPLSIHAAIGKDLETLWLDRLDADQINTQEDVELHITKYEQPSGEAQVSYFGIGSKYHFGCYCHDKWGIWQKFCCGVYINGPGSPLKCFSGPYVCLQNGK